MTAYTRIATLVLMLAGAAMLQGCIEAAVFGGAAATAAVAADRRQPENLLGDERIEVTASSRVDNAMKDTAHVNITSYNYNVLLLGEAPSEEAKARIERIVVQVPQVKSVLNEMRVAGNSSLASRSNDTYLTGKVKANFVAKGRKFAPNHVKVVTENGVVYLLGLVTREEAEEATDLARSTSGVVKVVRVFEYVVKK